MPKIVKETINFNKLIYSRPCIVSAIRAYRKVAVFSLRENKNCYMVEIDKNNMGVEIAVKDEFCNYILGTMMQ